MSIWIMTIAVVFNLSLYQPPNQMDWFLYPIPTFTFSRAICLICVECAYGNCVGGLGSIPSEARACIFALYISFVVYLALAMYLY